VAVANIFTINQQLRLTSAAPIENQAVAPAALTRARIPAEADCLYIYQPVENIWACKEQPEKAWGKARESMLPCTQQSQRRLLP
jgi:hypothetical protein